MEVWPSGAALRGEASNHRLLRWLKTVVVSEAEKAHLMRQVGIGKTVRSSLVGVAVEVSLRIDDAKTGAEHVGSGMSSAGAR
jgi:hypothetical protein